MIIFFCVFFLRREHNTSGARIVCRLSRTEQTIKIKAQWALTHCLDWSTWANLIGYQHLVVIRMIKDDVPCLHVNVVDIFTSCCCISNLSLLKSKFEYFSGHPRNFQAHHKNFAYSTEIIIRQYKLHQIMGISNMSSIWKKWEEKSIPHPIQIL